MALNPNTVYSATPGIFLTQPYEVKSVVALRRDKAARNDGADSPQQELKVKIKKLQQPWTLSCGMVVDVLHCEAAPADVYLDDPQRRHFQIKGVLLEYIPGFSLRDLSTNAPPGSWQDIANQAVEIARSLGDHGVLNRDVRPDNFIVCHRTSDAKGLDGRESGEEDGGFHVFMIDFGQSRVRGDNESDFDWGRDKWQQDEEGAVGLVMQHRLQNLGAILYTPSARYLEFAEGEDGE
ncbi:hypothetical protein MFIFM68171_02609 [Madurella fahalii]|uniref:Protein kinase domain-containing protein n=1 Tax=Madurella fahalii TaxID=1157608 RepID=A0ABQ0G3X1_9PEZI